MSNIFSGYNQKMAQVIANTAEEGLTPANLFKNLIQEKNDVSAYFKQYINIDDLILDFKILHENQTQDAKYQKSIENTLRNIKKISSDRFSTEITFMHSILSARQNAKIAVIFNNVVAKYLKPEFIKEDFERMVNPKPNLEWASDEDTILDEFGRDMTKLAYDGELQEIVDRDEEIMRMIQILTRQTKSNPALIGEAGVGKTALVEKLAFVLNNWVGIPVSLHGYKLYEISIPAIIATRDIEGVIAEIIKVTSTEKIILFMDEVHMIMDDNGKIANLLKPAMARGDIKLIGATTADEYKAFENDKAMTRRFQPVKIDAPDKVSVYRILKSKAREAEKAHNVLIPDETLLKSIQLSERYLQHRNQPDKSIDLLEEASAKLRMILESKPEPLITILNDISDEEIKIEMIQVGTSQLSERDNEEIRSIKENLESKYAEKNRLESKYNEQKKLIVKLVQLKEAVANNEKILADALHYGDFVVATKMKMETIPKAIKAVEETEQEIIDFAKTTDENLIQNVVTPNMIARIIEDVTSIPVTAQDEEDLAKYKNMEITLKDQIHGQDKPIDKISAAIKRAKAGLADGNKPLGSFLCLGPTGVGKTYLAQTIAKFMFDTDKVMHRFDMSEYMEAHSVARLFGSPPGYVGHDAGGQLTEAVKRNPYSIILFDEIEKAHPRVFDALLQILDAGRMTDGQGHEINFKNTIIIMTSNIGSNIIRLGMEKGHPSEAIEIALFEEVNNHFRPEFLNRFDAKVMFNSLTPEAIIKIADSELNKLAERLAQDNDIELHWHKDLPAVIASRVYDPINGARPVKRYINDAVLNVLTKEILSGSISKNSIVYTVPETADENEEIHLIQVTRESLKQIKDEEQPYIDTDIPVLKKAKGKGDKDNKGSKGRKDKKNKKKEDIMNMTFSLDTQLEG